MALMARFDEARLCRERAFTTDRLLVSGRLIVLALVGIPAEPQLTVRPNGELYSSETNVGAIDTSPLTGAVALHAHQCGGSFAEVSDAMKHQMLTGDTRLLDLLSPVVLQFQTMSPDDIVADLVDHGVPDESIDIVWSNACGGPRRGPRLYSTTPCSRARAMEASRAVRACSEGMTLSEFRSELLRVLKTFPAEDAVAYYAPIQRQAACLVGIHMSDVFEWLDSNGVDDDTINLIWEWGFFRYVEGMESTEDCDEDEDSEPIRLSSDIAEEIADAVYSSLGDEAASEDDIRLLTSEITERSLKEALNVLERRTYGECAIEAFWQAVTDNIELP